MEYWVADEEKRAKKAMGGVAESKERGSRNL